MKSHDENYLLSNGDADDEYGLFIMEADETKNDKIMYLSYFFDEDRFTYIKKDELKLFVKPSSLISCKDEFGNEYIKESLNKRIREAIKAFKEELPGFKAYEKETNKHFSTLE